LESTITDGGESDGESDGGQRIAPFESTVTDECKK
jgi:hypothetical protein